MKHLKICWCRKTSYFSAAVHRYSEVVNVQDSACCGGVRRGGRSRRGEGYVSGTEIRKDRGGRQSIQYYSAGGM